MIESRVTCDTDSHRSNCCAPLACGRFSRTHRCATPIECDAGNAHAQGRAVGAMPVCARAAAQRAHALRPARASATIAR
jgi:hypothetical protein